MSKRIIVGIDEVGTGPIAGPVVVAACQIETGAIPGVRDSKTVAEERRYKLADEILRKAAFCFITERNIETINEIGVRECWKRIVQEAAEAAHEKFPEAVILMDGGSDPDLQARVPFLKFRKNGDDDVYQIAAASLIAKAYRDRAMIALDKVYPQYRFGKHKGYGTAEHIALIREHGPCPAHRKKETEIALASGKSVEAEVEDYSPAQAKAYVQEAIVRSLSDWEDKFVRDMDGKLDAGCILSPRQKFFLKKIAVRTRKKGRH